MDPSIPTWEVTQPDTTTSPPMVNGSHTNGFHDPPLDELERELPMVYDGQVPLGDVLSRVVQAIYAELSELAETMPNMSDSARKRTLADWVVKTKKQVVKLYAVVKWARDAETVQKCMNITAFLMNQNQQFEDAMSALIYARQSLDPARLRNHDLLTSLDVLTTGSYRRLPSCIKKLIVPPVPLTNEEVIKTLKDMEDVIRYRLCMTEIIPIEMSNYRIAGGRVYFTVPKLFEAALCLQGAQKDDGWFFVNVEFLITIGGDRTGMQEFPREPTGVTKRHIVDEADARLSAYLPPPSDVAPPGIETRPRPRLPDTMVDTPLVRLYNFLQIMCLSYQLEILWYQARRMCSLGWADYLKVEMTNNRKTLTASYWIRQLPPIVPGRPPPPPHRSKLPALGGSLIISIVPAHAPPQSGSGPARTPKARILAELQQRSKINNAKPSDEVEGLKFQVRWEPARGALGVVIPAEEATLASSQLLVDADDLDFESILRNVIARHTRAILNLFQRQLQHGAKRTVFSAPGEVMLVMDENTPVLHAHLCADEVVVVAIEPRTGRVNLRDTGDFGAAGRGPRFTAISEKLNENPMVLLDALIGLRLNTILDLAQQKANYLGLRSYRDRNFSKEQMMQLGPTARGMLYIQLSNFPKHYLVIVITDDEFRYALISVNVLPESTHGSMVMEDIAWLDLRRIHGVDDTVATGMEQVDVLGTEIVAKKKAFSGSFNLETQVLRELYAYCCARVAYTKVEQQLKLRGIQYTHVSPLSGKPISPELSHIQSSLAHAVPALCVQASHILSGAPAAEAAMSNIRVIPLNWWSNKKAQVVTCVKLKYVQQPMGKTAGTSTIIRPSKRIIYDTTEAVVSFLSEEVDTCVDEFLEEWARVSKMVVIAREVAQMAKAQGWHDVRLLSFDLQTVEFAYAGDYAVSITCTDQLSPTGGTFNLRFSRVSVDSQKASPSHQRGKEKGRMTDGEDEGFNPHDDAEAFLRSLLLHGHGRLAPSLNRVVGILRDTLPVVVELEEIRREEAGVDTFAKAAGWYRLLYGDLRHALDFRLMKGHRVAILDGSHSLFRSGGVFTVKGRGDSGTVNGSSSGAITTGSPGKKGVGKGVRQDDEDGGSLGLEAIPGFGEIVGEAVAEVGGTRIVGVDVGVICDVNRVRGVTRSLHSRVIRQLRGGV